VTKAEFDEFASTYADVTSQNTNFFDSDYGYFGRYRSNIIKKLSGPNVANILDFGCGVGLGIRPLREAFPACRIVGCDPSQESLALARASEPDCEFMEADAIEPGPQFDIVTAVSVFHHIAPSDRDGAFRYCFDRLKPGGHLFVFEHNPYNPVTRRLVARCPVDRDAILLKPKETIARFKRAGFDRVAAKYCLFFPKTLAVLRPMETSLGWLPLGGQYYVCGVRP
jgi:SAM-dependent methyltransferase